jgi:hypothetical protein
MSAKLIFMHLCIMEQLNFKPISLPIKNNENKKHIWDPFRKKWVLLTPEEWVRQHCLAFLVDEKVFPKTLINVEKQLIVDGVKKRYDIIVFSPQGKVLLLVECKAPNVIISQRTFDQIAQYNRAVQSHLLMVTNGINHYFCDMKQSNDHYHFIENLPSYKQLMG